MTITARQVSGPPPAAMRAGHLASLEEPQEFYLERRIARGATWLIEQDRIPAGYAVVDDEGALLELSFADSLACELATLFGVLTKAAVATRCLYQSFDPGMRTLAATVGARSEPIGVLFRRILDPSHRPRADAEVRPAIDADMARIAGIDDGFFADIEEVRRYLELGGLWVLEDAKERIIGCGIAQRPMPNGTDLDIGMMVAPEFRRRGYGSFIVSHLKSELLSKGLRPICRCGIDNVASRRAIQNAGFVADHRLLQFKVERA